MLVAGDQTTGLKSIKPSGGFWTTKRQLLVESVAERKNIKIHFIVRLVKIMPFGYGCI